MLINTTNSTIIASIEAINVLLNSDSVSYGTGLKLNRNLEQIKQAFYLYQAEEKALAEEYFERDENGNFIEIQENRYKIIPEKAEEYLEKINTLRSFEVELNLYKISFDEIKDVKIKPSLVPTLSYLVEDI